MSATDGVRMHSVTGRLGRAAVGPYELDVGPGEIACLVGPNGAGKTTCLQLMLGLRPHTGGTVLVHGNAVDHRRPPTRTGASLLDDGNHPWLTGIEELAQLGDLRPDDPGPEEALALVGLGPASHDRTGTYSAGMLRRLGIARALLGSPSLLVLDEPTASLDEGAGAWLADLLHHAAREGATIVLASHDNDLIERLGPSLIQVDRCRTP